MDKFDSGLLLLSTDFRKTLVSKQQNANGETEQIRKALVNFRYTNLNDQDKLLLAHDLAFIFTKSFYDFDHGCLLQEKSQFFRSDETLLFFSDYMLYFSFISSFYNSPSNKDSILNDISSPDSRKNFFLALREPLSPYLFITFINNLIDVINLSSQNNDVLSIENEMCRQIMINSKELSELSKFIDLHKNLLEKVKVQFKKSKKIVTKEMENNFTLYFAHSFYQTIVYPSSQFNDQEFKEMKKDFYKIQHTNSNDMKPLIERFSNEKDLISYHTYLYQRALCITQKGAWIHPAEERDIFEYPAQLRLTIISKKVGQLIGDNRQPIGNSVVIVIVPISEKDNDKLTVVFKYNNKSYSKKVVDGVVDCVFPCFKEIPLEISFLYQDKKSTKDVIVINSLYEPPENEIMKQIKFGNNKQPSTVVVTNKFYSHDKPLDNLIVHLNTNPKNLFDFVIEAFLHKYLSMNAQFIYVYRGEDDDDEDENDFIDDENLDPTKNLFTTNNKNLRVKQDISGRAFPVDYWLFLVDVAIKYSIPSSYFFSRIAEKMSNCWCSAQAYIDLYCIILYNLYYAINNSEHDKEEEEMFNATMQLIREKCVRLLLNQLAKPEIYQRPSITSLILLLSLSNEGSIHNLNSLLKTIFLSSKNNISTSIYKLLVYNESKNECTSMDLYNKITEKKEFPLGPNHLPLCNVDIESLKKALDLVLYRCRSITSFYLESFLPSFANIGDNIISDLKNIALSIADAFNKMDPFPDQKDLVYFVTVYQQIYQIFRKQPELNPASIFNDSIEQWLFDLSTSMIELVERSINFDNFEKRSEKARTSDSFTEIFLFFRQGFDFITNLNFTQQEIRDKLFFFLTITASLCSTYIEFMLSMASKQFRDSFNQPIPSSVPKIAKKPVKQKQVFPSWCPDITNIRMLSFEQICVMINNMASIRIKWFKYIVIYDKYLPNQPQIKVAVKATSDRRSLKDDKSSSSNLLNDDNLNEESVEGSKDTFKDPCQKLTNKITFMFNFLRLDLTYFVISMLNKKMWTSNVLNKDLIKQLRENFFNDDLNRVNDDNISTVFDKIFDEFKDRVQKVKDFLQVSLHLKCIPQLVRAVEDGIFECMIPMAFSTKSKNVFTGLLSKIEFLFTEMFNYIEEAGFVREIVNRAVGSLRFMPYIRTFIHLSLKEVEDELKVEKNKAENDVSNNIILLSIIIQVITPIPLPKTVNPNYTFISLE